MAEHRILKVAENKYILQEQLSFLGIPYKWVDFISPWHGDEPGPPSIFKSQQEAIERCRDHVSKGEIIPVIDCVVVS